MEAVLGPDTPQGEGSVAGAGEVGLDGGQLLELGHEPGQRWSHDTGDMAVSLSVSTRAGIFLDRSKNGGIVEPFRAP